MSVMSVLRLVLDVGGVDGNTTGLFLGCLVNLGVVSELGTSSLCQHFGNGGRKSGLPVIDMS